MSSLLKADVVIACIHLCSLASSSFMQWVFSKTHKPKKVPCSAFCGSDVCSSGSNAVMSIKWSLKLVLMDDQLSCGSSTSELGMFCFSVSHFFVCEFRYREIVLGLMNMLEQKCYLCHMLTFHVDALDRRSKMISRLSLAVLNISGLASNRVRHDDEGTIPHHRFQLMHACPIV